MTRLEALEAVAAAFAEVAEFEEECSYDHNGDCQAHWLHQRPCPMEGGRTALATLAALDQTAPQPPDVDPQPRRGSVAETAGIFVGPDSVEWLRGQRATPMIPDLLAQAYGEEQR